MRKTVLIVVFALLALSAQAQSYSFSGQVLEKKTGEPLDFATVFLAATEQWAVTDAEGKFTIKNIKVPQSAVSVSSLGYVTLSRKVDFRKEATGVQFLLEEDNLTLEGAMVTARENGESATTSRTIDKTALDHVQLMNVSDISSLLPGGVTQNNNLTADRQFNIRAGSSAESGNASFGTAVEVDGVRLSNNASYYDANKAIKGVSTNSIASSNVESVEVITGVPSVEYGDMGSGVVKINTRKGRTPWMVTLSTSPKTKQASFSKGFGLGSTAKGRSLGVINASAEYTRSVSDQMSPYTSYDRKQLSLTYSNTLYGGAFRAHPLRLSASVTGNLGGLDDKADPDKLTGTFIQSRDNALRASLTADWLLSLPWITNLELNASGSTADKRVLENRNYQQGVTDIALHAMQAGYYMSAPYQEGGNNPVVMIPPGNWYNIMGVDDRPVTAKVSLKANWATHFGTLSSKAKVGAEWNWDHNLGAGQYSEDPSTAPTWREYRYCDNPSMHNLGLYAEENLMVPAGQGRINLIAGIREDLTYIKGSAYGLTSSLSPRVNLKYTVLDGVGRADKFLRELSFRASWGVAVKLPSFSILYPTPGYLDVNVFTSTASADNTVYRAFYVQPRALEYNAALRWQRNQQAEVGVEASLGGVRISLAAFLNRTLDAYGLMTGYDRLTYNYTSTAAVQGLSIPAANRVYVLDPATGMVTVQDKTGALAPQTIQPEERKQFIPKTFEYNAQHPITRYGVEWVIDFPRIETIGTTIRLDGNYYAYKGIKTDITPNSPYTITGSDGKPFRYIGFYYGGNNVSNGSQTRTLRNNLTITTHIPKVRMILSVKLEATLLRYSRSLAEQPGVTRTYVLRELSNPLSYDPSVSIYEGDNYAVTFPDYYESYDQPGVQVPYLEKLRWAKENDPALYADLSKLAVPYNFVYGFRKDYISPYFSANFSITKELGDVASISFYANNFFNNMGQVLSSRTGTYSSLSSYIPAFYYGLTVRLKF